MSQELKTSFIERILKKEYTFFFICFILFIDILCHFSWDRDLSSLTQSDIRIDVTTGSVVLVITGYLVFMSLLIPKTRSLMIKIIFSTPLSSWIYRGERRNLFREPVYIRINKLKEYAQEHNSTILFEQIKQREKEVNRFQLLDNLNFSICVLLLINIWLKNSFFHKIIYLAPNSLPLLITIVFTIYLIFKLLHSLVKVDDYRYMYMPEHPIAKEREKEKMEMLREKIKREEKERKFKLKT